MPDERYEDFLGPLPQFAPDPRQANFLSRVGESGGPKKAMIDLHRGRVEIANVGRGWFASSPNMGFLYDGVKKLIELGKLNPQSKKEVAQFLGWATQRVIRTTTSLASDELQVRFWTRDDHCVYGFEFAVEL
ncbi:MAG: hypothetical protein ACO3ME_09355 [Ilumatobacteraceae bacterium]